MSPLTLLITYIFYRIFLCYTKGHPGTWKIIRYKELFMFLRQHIQMGNVGKSYSYVFEKIFQVVIFYILGQAIHILPFLLIFLMLQVALRWKDVVGITKEKTALVIPNAIQIVTENDERHFLTSFAARDRTYMMLFKLWQNALLDQVKNRIKSARLHLDGGTIFHKIYILGEGVETLMPGNCYGI